MSTELPLIRPAQRPFDGWGGRGLQTAGQVSEYRKRVEQLVVDVFGAQYLPELVHGLEGGVAGSVGKICSPVFPRLGAAALLGNVVGILPVGNTCDHRARVCFLPAVRGKKSKQQIRVGGIEVDAPALALE